ncbi:MAG: hypothetical protein Q9195_005824 [Heterodermia aff. obscurata]
MNQVFISCPDFETVHQWGQCIEEHLQQKSRPDHRQDGQKVVDTINCAKISYSFCRTPIAQNCVEVCANGSACFRPRRLLNEWHKPYDGHPGSEFDTADWLECPSSLHSFRALPHNQLEEGAGNHRFVNILRTALDELLSGSIFSDGDLAHRWKSDRAFDAPEGRTFLDFTQESEQKLLSVFPVHSHRIRTFIRELRGCQQEHALLLARLNIERLTRLLASASTSTSALEPQSWHHPILEAHNLGTWLLQTVTRELLDLAGRMFAWILWASRPLFLQELSCAMHLYWELPTSTVKPTRAELRALEDLGNSIGFICGGLVRVGCDQTVCFIDHEVKRCLIADREGMKYNFTYQGAQELLGLTCLHVLSWHTKGQQQQPRNTSSSADFYLSKGGLGLLCYACANWAQHCRSAETDSYYILGAIQEYLKDLLSSNSRYIWNKTEVPAFPEQIYWQNGILNECARHGFIELSRMCLDMGADINSKGRLSASSPLSAALSNQHWDLAAILIERGASYDLDVGQEAICVLHHASACGRGDIVNFLLQHRVNPNGANISAETALHCAAMSNQPEIVRQLILAGSDPNKATLLTKETPLHLAASLNCEGAVRNLVEFADTMAKNHQNWTALHCAAAYGHTNIVKIIIEHGADINDLTSSGLTPLALAIHYNHTSAANLIRSSSSKRSFFPYSDNTLLGHHPITPCCLSTQISAANLDVDERDKLKISVSSSRRYKYPYR